MIDNTIITPDMLDDYKKLKNEINENEVGFWDYLMYRGNFELAFAFAKLFWPEFIKVDNYILLKEKYEPEHFKMWKQELNNEPHHIEALINHIHIYDLFLNTDNSTNHLPPLLLTQLGQIITHLWKLALKESFPDRKFEVIFTNEPEDYGPTVTFYQKKPPTTSP